jgi:hypothetical protein
VLRIGSLRAVRGEGRKPLGWQGRGRRLRGFRLGRALCSLRMLDPAHGATGLILICFRDALTEQSPRLLVTTGVYSEGGRANMLTALLKNGRVSCQSGNLRLSLDLAAQDPTRTASHSSRLGAMGKPTSPSAQTDELAAGLARSLSRTPLLIYHDTSSGQSVFHA